MLKQLYIKNYTLIDELDISFGPGFSVITGETGAGKSIILGAIGLLLGQRADTKAIKTGTEKCIIEAHFDLSQYHLQVFFQENDIDYIPEDSIIRRELTATGKSRAFINDTPVQLGIMKELGERLIDIHSQHQNLLLNKEDFQLNVIDIIANNSQKIGEYQKEFDNYQIAERQLKQLKEDIEKSRENEDFLRYQFKELDDAHLEEDEQELLEQESGTMNHAEEIKSALYSANHILNGDEIGIVSQLRTVTQNLQNIEDVYSPIKEISARLDSSYIELKDIADEVNVHMDKIEFDPQRMEYVNGRLNTIYSLQQKYHLSTIAELLQLKENIGQQLGHIEHSDEELSQTEQQVAKLKECCMEMATELSSIRKKTAKLVEKEMAKRLIPLGIPHVRFEITFDTKPLSKEGIDKVCFLFSANKSTPLQPVAQIASGGEIARVMLSLKAMISGTIKLPTIIFDEIDTGVSGKIAEMMAEIMLEMGNQDRQVISITHLPQIAALGIRHYRVSKTETSQGTISNMEELDHAGRIREIAQMLSGSDITDAAINNAKALLKIK